MPALERKAVTMCLPTFSSECRWQRGHRLARQRLASQVRNQSLQFGLTRLMSNSHTGTQDEYTCLH